MARTVVKRRPSSSDILEKLNSAQRRAVLAIEGPVLVLAEMRGETETKGA